MTVDGEHPRATWFIDEYSIRVSSFPDVKRMFPSTVLSLLLICVYWMDSSIKCN